MSLLRSGVSRAATCISGIDLRRRLQALREFDGAAGCDAFLGQRAKSAGANTKCQWGNRDLTSFLRSSIVTFTGGGGWGGWGGSVGGARFPSWGEERIIRGGPGTEIPARGMTDSALFICSLGSCAGRAREKK